MALKVEDLLVITEWEYRFLQVVASNGGLSGHLNYLDIVGIYFEVGRSFDFLIEVLRRVVRDSRKVSEVVRELKGKDSIIESQKKGCIAEGRAVVSGRRLKL